VAQVGERSGVARRTRTGYSFGVKFTLSIALSPLDHLTELAKTAEECGFSSVALPDSLFFSETVSAEYPYTPDGSRFWSADTPWVDPLVATAAMGAVTSSLRFYTSVLKLGPRNPVLLARQVASVATLTNNRFGLGVGIGWAPEEFEWCGAPYARRGRRMEEEVEILALILGGGMVEYHGEIFDFDRLQMSPAPTERVPIYVGGHTERALDRAARLGDGWSSAMMTLEELEGTIERLNVLRAKHDRADKPFEFQAVCIDKFGVDGYKAQADVGVTDAIVVPWLFYGVGFDSELSAKKDAVKRFADEVISPLR
jgi:probable F420-dependent oxidoreductase